MKLACGGGCAAGHHLRRVGTLPGFDGAWLGVTHSRVAKAGPPNLSHIADSEAFFCLRGWYRDPLTSVWLLHVPGKGLWGLPQVQAPVPGTLGCRGGGHQGGSLRTLGPLQMGGGWMQWG